MEPVSGPYQAQVLLSLEAAARKGLEDYMQTGYMPAQVRDCLCVQCLRPSQESLSDSVCTGFELPLARQHQRSACLQPQLQFPPPPPGQPPAFFYPSQQPVSVVPVLGAAHPQFPPVPSTGIPRPFVPAPQQPVPQAWGPPPRPPPWHNQPPMPVRVTSCTPCACPLLACSMAPCRRNPPQQS